MSVSSDRLHKLHKEFYPDEFVPDCPDYADLKAKLEKAKWAIDTLLGIAHLRLKDHDFSDIDAFLEELEVEDGKE